MDALTALRFWSPRRWLIAAAGALATALLLGLPTDVIPNPLFGRQGTPVTWWSYLVLVVSAVLSGLLLATYVNVAGVNPAADTTNEPIDGSGRAGGIGALFTFFAIGCPICNKIVLLAVGTAGATRWFAPLQPWLAVGSIVLLAWAVRTRLRGELACPINQPAPAASPDHR